VCVCVCGYTYIHTYIHTHTHIKCYIYRDPIAGAHNKRAGERGPLFRGRIRVRVREAPLKKRALSRCWRVSRDINRMLYTQRPDCVGQ
jgi:hypothetical protein